MHPVLRFAVGADDARRLLRSTEATVMNVRVLLWLPGAGRKDEVVLAGWAPRLPLRKRVKDRGAHRNSTLARFGLGRSKLTIPILALPDVDHARIEIYVGPAKPEQFRYPHASESRRSQNKTPVARRMRDYRSNFGSCREVNARGQLPLARRSVLIRTGNATFWATAPRRCASERMDFSDVSSFRAITRERVASN